MSVSFFDMFAGTRQCRATFRARSLTTLNDERKAWIFPEEA